ncbi:MAG: hypothetical protein K6F28_09780 [Lachnospiraceae bacterium]|nr:hypothetical protein [Lachnospiraceae bacterium]
MESLLIVKQQLARFYTRFEAFIVPVLKFLAMLIALLMIGSSVGFMSKLKNPAIVLIIALLCSFLPTNVIVLMAGLVIVAHMYALSLECCVVVLFVFIIMYALYFRFTPGDAIAVLLTPVAFVFHIPYVMPLAMGFTGNPISCISVGCGTAVYYILHYVSEHQDALSNGSSMSDLDVESMLGGFKTVIDGILKNDEMVAMIVTFAATIIVVYLIRKLRINYSWQIALGVGMIVCFVVLLVSSAVLDAEIGIGGAMVSLLVSAVIVLILQFFIFNVDYSRAEYVQFEDDEYYYYVKAIPKITLEAPAVKVRRSNVRRNDMDFDDEDEDDEDDY